MHVSQERRIRAALVAALVAPLALTLILVPFRMTFASTAASLLLVAVIAAVAIVGNRFTGVVASISAALWFDFFLTMPYQRFAMSHRSDIETAICLLLVGIIVTELAARSRHHYEFAAQQIHNLRTIHDLADLAASSAATSLLISETEASLTKLLGLRACQFEPGEPREPMARIDPDGSVMQGKLIWPADKIGIPGPKAEVRAQWRGRTLGRFVLVPSPGEPVSRESRLVATSLVELVGAALANSDSAS